MERDGEAAPRMGAGHGPEASGLCHCEDRAARPEAIRLKVADEADGFLDWNADAVAANFGFEDFFDPHTFG